MNDNLIELRSRSGLAKNFGTYVLRVTKEGVFHFSEGIVTVLAKENTFIPWVNISSVEVYTILFQTNIKVIATSGKTYEVVNVEKQVAKDAQELILKLQKGNQNNNTKPISENVNSNLNIADELEKLSKLKDIGILTQEEFENQKQKLLRM